MEPETPVTPPATHNPHSIWLPVVVSNVFCLILGFILGQRFYSASTSPLPIPVPAPKVAAPNVKSGWTSYENDAGFSVGYPMSYVYQESSGGGRTAFGVISLARFEQAIPKASLEIILDSSKFSLENLRRYAPTGSEDIDPGVQNINNNVFYYYGPGGGGVSYPDRYFTNLKGQILVFDFDGPYENDKTPPESAKALERQILSTFQFSN